MGNSNHVLESTPCAVRASQCLGWCIVTFMRARLIRSRSISLSQKPDKSHPSEVDSETRPFFKRPRVALGQSNPTFTMRRTHEMLGTHLQSSGKAPGTDRPR